MGNRTYWSAPVPPLGITSNTQAVTTAINDVSPQQTNLMAGALELGTRIRLRAYGEYTATSATPALILGFYLNGAGVALTTTPAVLAACAATAVNASAAAWPWMAEYEGQVRALTNPAAGTTAQVYGMGKLWLPASLTSFAAPVAMPATAAARTVAQTATGLITSAEQTVSVATTWSTVTGVTSFTCDELTLELLG
jgi:hypothetical protein